MGIERRDMQSIGKVISKSFNQNGRTERSVGVIGLGSVGKAVEHAFRFYYETVGYDIRGVYYWEDVLDTDVVFVCVPTPSGEDERLDCSAVDSVLSTLEQGEYSGLVIIKSTIRIGYMEHAVGAFPSLRLVYMPEFLRERSTLTWFMNPDRLVFSGEPADVEEALSYFSWVEGAEILRMSHHEAELGKLAHNAYIAVKVTFTNEMETICKEFGANPEAVMSVIWADRRVKSREHLRPHLGPYGGKCVPKDTREIISATPKAVMLRAVERVNETIIRETSKGLGNPDFSDSSDSDETET